jgi:DNA-binding response OmpR family regulator
MMPKMDGYEVCSHLKREEKTSHIPVILLTAKAALEDKIGGLETGADDYLVKPFDAGELLARVKNLIDLRRKLREKFGKELVALRPDEVKVTPAEQVFLKKVMDVIEQRMANENFAVEDLASSVNMSYTQLHRKLKAVTDKTAAQFIRSMRLKRAMEMLSQNGGTVSEIAYTVGFGSPAYFTRCFQEEYGKTPSEVKAAG